MLFTWHFEIDSLSPSESHNFLSGYFFCFLCSIKTIIIVQTHSRLIREECLFIIFFFGGEGAANICAWLLESIETCFERLLFLMDFQTCRIYRKPLTKPLECVAGWVCLFLKPPLSLLSAEKPSTLGVQKNMEKVFWVFFISDILFSYLLLSINCSPEITIK